MNQNTTTTKLTSEESNSYTVKTPLQSTYNPYQHRGEVGWICPVCGRGNAPSTAYCNCNMTRQDIVYLNSVPTIKDVFDRTVSSTTGISSNGPSTGSVYGVQEVSLIN